LPNFDRTGQCDGFRVGTPAYSPPRKESNTRLYLVFAPVLKAPRSRV
jgi:hypothetical protein